MERGDAALDENNYSLAIQYYEWASKGPEKRPALERLGECYRITNNYEAAENTFSQLVEISPNNSQFIYKYGQSLLASGKVDEARKWFGKYLDKIPKSKNTEHERNFRRLFSGLSDDPEEVSVSKAPFNSEASDFSPVRFRKGWLFCSTRAIEDEKVSVEGREISQIINLFYTEQGRNGHWTKAVPYHDLNSENNDGPCVIDPREVRVYLTRNMARKTLRNAEKSGLNLLNIFSAKMGLKGWEKLIPLPFCSKDYSVAHPALSPNGQRLFFASNMPGGLGGTDIYYVEKRNNGWSSPRNAGRMINTSGNELFPFVHPKGELYFASDGHPGLGGLDIFHSKIQRNRRFNLPINAAAPINSAGDDFGIAFDKSGYRGFFSSNRQNQDQTDDIYEFVLHRRDFKPSLQKETTYCFRFWDDGELIPDSTGEIDSTAPMIYEWEFGDGTKYFGKSVRHCFPGPGNYLVTLNLIDTVSNFILYNRAIYDHKIREPEQAYIDAPFFAEVGIPIRFDAQKTTLKRCDVDRYFWEFGDGGIGTGEKTDYTYAKAGSYEVVLGVRGISEPGKKTCQAAVKKKLQVLSSSNYQLVLDSVDRVRRMKIEENRILHTLQADTLLMLQIISEKVIQIRDSLDNLQAEMLERQEKAEEARKTHRIAPDMRAPDEEKGNKEESQKPLGQHSEAQEPIYICCAIRNSGVYSEC